MIGLVRVALVLVALAAMAPSAAAENPRLRIGVLKFGTVNWELDVIRHHGLDRAEGIALEVVQLASKQATTVALQGGAVAQGADDAGAWTMYGRGYDNTRYSPLDDINVGNVNGLKVAYTFSIGTLSQREMVTGRAFDRQIGSTKRGDRYADRRIWTGFAFDRPIC